MTIATGSKVQIGWINESVYGTTPATPVLATMPVTDWQVNTTKEIYQDMSIRGNRMHYYDIHSNLHVTGDFGIELNGANFDMLWQSLLSSTWATNVIKKNATDVQFSMSMEVAHTDIGLYQLITGGLVDKLSLAVPTKAIVTAKVSLVGLDQTLTDTSVSGSAYTAETINQPFVHNGGTLKEGGDIVGYVADFKLDVDNKYVANFGLGVTTVRAFTPGFLDVSGSIQVFFEDEVMYNKFLNATASSLEVSLTNGSYTIDILIPNVVYETANKTIKGQQAVILDMNYRGVFDSVTGTVIQVTRGS